MRTIRTHWLRLLGTALVSLTLAACTGDASQSGRTRSVPANAGQPDGGTNVSGSSINVVATNFAFSLGVSQLRAGTHTFVVTNEGSAKHDLVLSGNGVDQRTALLGAGETDSFIVDLKPGTYTFICSVPGHDELGMRGSITVSE